MKRNWSYVTHFLKNKRKGRVFRRGMNFGQSNKKRMSFRRMVTALQRKNEINHKQWMGWKPRRI
jgi:hypothetical protein